MAKTVREVFFSSNFNVSTGYPVAFFMRIKEILSMHGEVSNADEKIYSSAAGKSMNASFEVRKNIDNVSSMVIWVRVIGDEQSLGILAECGSLTTLNDGESIFNEFYSSSQKKHAVTRAREMSSRALRDIENEVKNSSLLSFS